MIGKEEAAYYSALDTIHKEQDSSFELDDILDYAVSTVVDIGTSAVNSLAWVGSFGQVEDLVDTGEVLHWMNDDMGDFYDNNKDLVQLSSFIGGLVIPGMAASKAMKWAKSGRTWLGDWNKIASTERNIQNSMRKAGELAAKGAEFQGEFNAAVRSMRLNTVGQGLMEGVVYEASFLALMKEHAYLDEHYDIGDFALGAGLGALVGPLRLFQQNKELRSVVNEAHKTYVEPLPHAIGYRGETAGDTLATQATLTRYIKESPEAAKHTATDLYNKSLRESYLNLRKSIANMSDTGIKDRIKVIKGSDTPLGDEFISTGDDLFDTPDVLLGSIATRNPESMRGVEKFVHYDADKPMSVFMSNAVEEIPEGFKAYSGNIAKDVLLSKNMRKPAEDIASVIATMPDKITITSRAGYEEIRISSALKASERGWLNTYLQLPHVSTSPVEIIGDLKGIKINQNKLINEAAISELEKLGPGFHTYDEMIDGLTISKSDTAVVDPYFGKIIMSEMEANAAKGAAASAKVKINTAASIYDDIKAVPYVDDTAIVDGAWIQAQYMAKNSDLTRAVQIRKDEGVLYKLQGIINEVASTNKAFPKIVFTGTDETINTMDDAIKYLWEAKQEMVHAGVKRGASMPQIARTTNLSLETVETISLAKGQILNVDEAVPFARYNTNNPDAYLAAKPIATIGKPSAFGRVEEINITRLMDESMMDDIHNSIVHKEITNSGIPELMTSLTEVYQSDKIKFIGDNLSSIFGRLEDRYKKLQSADFSLRDLGTLGEHITELGKAFLHNTNLHISRVRETIMPVLEEVAKDTASRVQYAAFKQALHAIPGKEAKNIFYDAASKRIGLAQNARTGEVTWMKYANTEKPQEIVLTDAMHRFMQSWLPIQKEMLQLDNVARSLNGLSPTRGSGIWLPYMNLTDKFVAYKMAKTGNKVELIVSDTADGLQQLVRKAREEFKATHKIITKAESDEWVNLNRLAELENFKVADVSLRKSGITGTELETGTESISELFESVKAHMWMKHRRIFKASNPKVFDTLDFHARHDAAAFGGDAQIFQQKLQRKIKTSEFVSNILLNKSMLHDDVGLSAVNNITSALWNAASNRASKAIKAARAGGRLTEHEYERVVEELAKADIPLPPSWKTLQDYEIAAARNLNKDVAQHQIHKANSIMVLLNLRLGEVAHSAVTLLSAPVLMIGEISHMKGRPMKAMAEGFDFLMKAVIGTDDEAVKVMKYAADRGLAKSIIAETVEMSKDFYDEIGFFAKHKKVLDFLCTPSDWSERVTRELAFATGYLLAKQKAVAAGEKVSLELLASSASAFVTRTMGNYVSRQRPTLFQGSFGAMVGLYQTFMLTMGQNMARYVEAKDMKAITRMMAMQGSIFGIESLPGYKVFNETVGAHLGEDHADIRSTTYKAFGDTEDQSRSMAEYILYGLPSALFGTAIYTRATLDPRTPLAVSTEEGFTFKPPVLDAAVQAGKFLYNTVDAAGRSLGNGNILDFRQAVYQGIAAQHLWRPGARYAELAMGKSYDQKGELVSEESDVYSEWSFFARAMGARPLKEHALRNLRFVNSYYNTVDKDRTAKVRKQVRRLVASPHSKEEMDRLFVEYIDNGGAYSGWKRLINEAYMSSDVPYANRVLENTTKQKTVQDIIDTYN